MAAVPGVRPVADPLDGPGDWRGYCLNPHEPTGTRFHDRPKRTHDAEVYFPASGRWLRAFYWHARREPGFGVVTFAGGPTDGNPVWDAAWALAAHLGAELIGEDATAYEQVGATTGGRPNQSLQPTGHAMDGSPCSNAAPA